MACLFLKKLFCLLIKELGLNSSQCKMFFIYPEFPSGEDPSVDEGGGVLGLRYTGQPNSAMGEEAAISSAMTPQCIVILRKQMHFWGVLM